MGNELAVSEEKAAGEQAWVIAVWDRSAANLCDVKLRLLAYELRAYSNRSSKADYLRAARGLRK